MHDERKADWHDSIKEGDSSFQSERHCEYSLHIPVLTNHDIAFKHLTSLGTQGPLEYNSYLSMEVEYGSFLCPVMTNESKKPKLHANLLSCCRCYDDETDSVRNENLRANLRA